MKYRNFKITLLILNLLQVGLSISTFHFINRFTFRILIFVHMTTLETILINQREVFVLDASLSYETFVPLDLSITNKELSQLSLKTASDYEAYLDNYLNNNNAQVAFGGYMEHRNLYQRSTIFNDAQTDERTIHIGLDLWTKAGTKVLAALDGVVHSFQYNNNLGDYGPTIILKHILNNIEFYTLYGHLSLKSLEHLKIGQSVTKGAIIATLGDAAVNGDYAPHLHFQIIKNIGNHSGDYPGVCSTKDVPYYLENCPDPNLLLKINQ